MARNQYQASAGTKLYYGDLPGTLTKDALDAAAVNQLSGITAFPTLPDSAIATFDTTNTDQVDENGDDDFIEQFGLGYETPGMLEFVLAASDTEVVLANSLKAARDHLAFKVLFSKGSRLVFWGALVNIQGQRDEKGATTYKVTIKLASRPEYIPVAAVILLESVTENGAKTLTLAFSGVVNASTFTPADLLVIHGGTAVPTTTIMAGAETNQINITATGFQTNPAGDTLALLAAPAGVRAPVSKIVKAS